ncbi:RIP metalloprotease RseP [Neisseria sp.]|uniref:RIP metalloprotease RseP n=1 Tax=Neisseria sp. TaxID=192066 RepID=UPI0035A1137B
MNTILAFLVAILILVSLHEFGHYIVARWCGVKVLRFSVGFGKPFLKKKRGDTEWCLAPIPLGGYVKMVDTREGNVAPEDLPYAFDKQHPAKKIAIVAAGPLTNLILAVLFYGLSFSFGVTEIRPFAGTVEPASIAAKAGFQSGDKIRSVNGKAVKDWGDTHTEIILNMESGKVDVAVQTASGADAVRTIDVAGTPEAGKVAKNHGNIGLSPFRNTMQVAEVSKGGAAEKAGLKAGDTLVAANGKPLSGWADWVVLVRASADKDIALEYLRGGVRQTATVRPTAEIAGGQTFGKVGLAAQPDQAWNDGVRYRFVPSVGEAFAMGWDKMAEYSRLTLEFFGKLLTGQASLSHISGPLTIADVAGKTAEQGWQSYVEFLALVSVSLGIMNLLPVPVLDGGHLVYYSVEWIMRRPLGERVQQMGMRIGLALMLMLMTLAFYNDINRLFG